MSGWRDMTIEAWPDAAAALADAGVSTHHSTVLLRHIVEHLVGGFGVERFEAYRGKEGQQIHSVEEIAAVVAASLAPALAAVPADALDELISSRHIGQRLRHPWEMTS